MSDASIIRPPYPEMSRMIKDVIMREMRGLSVGMAIESIRLRNEISDFQCTGPDGVWLASWPTASAMRRQTAAPL